MRKFILFALLLSGLITSAQTGFSDGNCKAFFKYAVNTQIMTLVPATAINFFDKSEGPATAWYWDFGDGNTSQEQNPLHIFIHPIGGPTVKISPYRTVSLTIKTGDVCKSFYSETINIMDGTTFIPPVIPTCLARFKYYQTAYDLIGGTASFQLTNISEGDSLKYLWQFDNGKTSTEREPKVTFDLKQPERKVCLTITGAKNCVDNFCDAVYITDPNKPVIVPNECYTGFGYSVNTTIKTFAPALVLDFYSKALPGATEWKWDFGDGYTSIEANPTHIFNFPLVNSNVLGDPNPFRKVCLTMKTASGCIANYCESINIYMSTIPPPVEPVAQCHAWFKYYRPADVISIPELIPYKFIDVSEGKVVKRLWEFEDGKTSTEAEPLVSFNFSKPTQKVCLTTSTADGCTNTWCDVIYVSSVKPDSGYISKPATLYAMRINSSFPIQMSSCAGTAKAQVYKKDSLVKADNYVWSTGQQGQEVKGLCPTRIYSVKAKTPDGTIVSSTFIFNAVGPVTETPVNWWVSGAKDNTYIQYNLNNTNYTAEWRLCDGTVVKSDSLPLNSINCGTSDSYLILKDLSGNIVYAENISMKTLVSGLVPDHTAPSFKLYPNPVNDVLNIQFSGNSMKVLQIEIFNIAGQRMSIQELRHVEQGQNLGLNVNSLQKGSYICKMISENQLIGVEKFIK